ncbi:uncharacterized protein LOC105249847 [Camponotus floridanus]|uniref:uncharacterized protein LOC105249847 n=1 Tax=Camponotus floridanus TaxID=104421 RepID=UPI00059DB2B6|nr:uncharacterized protein LOC105249847 [Camponotus floridanus]
MEIRSFLITILVVAFALLHYGEAKRCYQCDSNISKTCASEPSSREEVECPTNACGVCTYKLNGDKGVVRGCGRLELSQSISVDNCFICSEDLCNNANMVTISMTALGCLVSFWVIQFVLTNSY